MDIHETEARCRLVGLLAETLHESASCTTGVYEELVHILEGVKAVSTTPAQNIHIQFIRLGQKKVWFVRDECETLQETNAKAAVGDDLGQWEGGGLDVIAALHNLEIGGDGSQVLVRVLIGQVSKAKRLADLSGGEELLELGGDIKRPVRDVEVPYNENEEGHLFSLAMEEK